MGRPSAKSKHLPGGPPTINLDAKDPENEGFSTGQDVINLDARGLKLTPQGGLQGPANLTKVGIFNYLHQEGPKKGQIVREYRPAEEVFAADSLATLENAPITDYHPSFKISADGLVHPDNYTTLSKGHVTGIAHDELHVTGQVLVQDAAEAQLVLDRKRNELSCGYRYRQDWTPGTFQGKAYDLVQREITYNHVALLPRGGGRQGSDVALRFDSVIVRESVMMIQFDGKDFDLSTDEGRKGYAAAVKAKADAEVAVARDAATAATKRADTLQANFDGATAELAPLKAEKTAEARTALETKARKIMKAEPTLAFDSKLTDRALKEQAIKVAVPTLDLSKVSDDYVNARFDGLFDAPPPGDGGLEAARRAMSPLGLKEPATVQPSPEWANGWKKPLAASKDR